MPIDATWTIGAKDRSQKALASAGKGVDTFGAKFSSFGKTASRGLGIAGVALAGFATKAVGNLIKTGDNFDKMAGRTGFTVEQLSGLQFALEQSGSSLETFERGARNLNKNLQDAAGGTASAAAKFKEIGLDVAALKGLNPDQVFNTVADAIAGIEDPAQRAAAAGELLGQKAGPELLNLIKGGSDGIAELRQEAEDLGRVMSTETAASAAAAGDSLNRVKSSFAGVTLELAGALLPAIELMTPVVERLTGFIRSHSTPVFAGLGVAVGALGVAKAVNLAVGAFGQMKAAVTAISGVIKAATATQWGLNAALLANPLVAVTAAVVALGGAVFIAYKKSETFRNAVQAVGRALGNLWDRMRSLGEWIISTFVDNWQWVIAGALGPVGVGVKLLIDNWDSIWDTMRRLGGWLQTTFIGAWNTARSGIRSAVNGIIGIVESMANAAIGAINAIIGAWNSLDFSVPPFKISIPFAPDINFGGFTIGVPDIGKVPTITIPRLAQGGFVARPTLAVVGDAPGGEYVIPARQMRRRAAQLPRIDLHVRLELDGQALGQFVLNRVNNGIRNGEVSAVAELA